MKRLYFSLLVIFISTGLYAQTDVPPPSAYYLFDNETGTEITDASGNDHHGYWYNYFGEDPGETERTGWRPQEGYRNGAAYLAGDHVYSPNNCPDPNGGDCTCSSGSDLFVFAEDADGTCDDGFVPESNAEVFQTATSSFTLAFWFKNDWNYICDLDDPLHFSSDDDSDCAWERQVLWTMGDEESGLTLEILPGATVPAFLRASIKGSADDDVVTANAFYEPIINREWVHIAVVFEGDDGAGTGTLTLYLDGQEQDQEDTPFTGIDTGPQSAVFGGEHDKSVTGFNVTACWPDSDFLLCGIRQPDYNKVRYGWPARGWLDELAYWNSTALTQEQVVAFANPVVTSREQLTKYPGLEVVPSPANDRIFLQNLNADRSYTVQIFNAVGQQVQQIPGYRSGQPIMLSGNFNSGIYFLTVLENNLPVAARKFVVRR